MARTSLPGVSIEFWYSSSIAWSNSAGRPSEIGCLASVFLTVNSCFGPWKPCVRQPPAIAFSNSSQFGLVKALEAKW